MSAIKEYMMDEAEVLAEVFSKAGIKSGDFIVKINDEQVQGKTLMEAVNLMRGEVGTPIKLTVRRKGEKKGRKRKGKRKGRKERKVQTIVPRDETRRDDRTTRRDETRRARKIYLEEEKR